MDKRFSIIVINYGTFDLLLNFLDSIQNSNDSVLVSEVIIVDNGYPDKGDSREIIIPMSFPFKIQFVQNLETSYASGVNRGAALATMDTIVIANSDVELLPQSSLKPLVEKLWEGSHIGIAGPQLIYPDGRWQRSYGRFPSLQEAFISFTMFDSLKHSVNSLMFGRCQLSSEPKIVNYIDGVFMVIKRYCFEEMGGFDENYTFYGEDADFCWRAWQNGWKVVFVPSAHIIHVRGASSTRSKLEEYTVKLYKAKRKFVEKHYGPQCAERYEQFAKMAVFERMLVYNLFAYLTQKSYWRKRAERAKEMWNVLRRGE